MYHVKFMDCAPENRQKFRELLKQFKSEGGAEVIGAFYPRGSGYMFATVTKYDSYAIWEKYWAETSKKREEGINIVTKDMDMFFEKIEL